jgi:flavorubredoxin
VGWRGGATKKRADVITTFGFEALQDVKINYVLSNTELVRCKKGKELDVPIATKEQMGYRPV